MKFSKLTVYLVAVLSMAFTVQASPVSSATFEKALQDAEMVAALDPSWKVHRTVGDSMGHFFGDNSLIIVQEAALEQVREGMVVVYRTTEGELVSHKVVAIENGSLRTKGEANPSVDPVAVTAEMLVGTVFCVFHSESAPEGVAYSSTGAPLPTAVCKRF